jgi:predicted PurR-regulated permease PerM
MNNNFENDRSPASGPTRRFESRLGLVALALLLIGCLLVMRPFLSAFLWAAVLTFCTWPVYRRLLGWLGQRRTLAAAVMTLAMTLIVLMPFLVVGAKLAENVKELAAATRNWLDEGPPQPPGWLAQIPAVGSRAADYWRDLAGDSTKLLAEAKRFVEPASAGLLKGGLAIGRGVLELALSIFIAFFLFRDGLAAAEHLKSGVARIAGDRGRHLLEVAGSTVRGVVYGILGTAIVQAIMAGLGFVVAGVPGAAVLTLLTFFFSVVPMGPPLVWIPATIWLFQHQNPGWAIFMGIWGLLVSSVDNLVKPWLISQGSRMPFLLIFLGVIGGALAFGFIGVFLGPALLAVGFRLVKEWMAQARADGSESVSPAETAPPPSTPAGSAEDPAGLV